MMACMMILPALHSSARASGAALTSPCVAELARRDICTDELLELRRREPDDEPRRLLAL